MSDRTAQTELPPPMVFMQLLFGKQLTYSLSGVARLGVADHMDKTARPIEELAAKVGAHAPSLYRVMRLLASLGVFKEGPQRHFALTPVGELLKTDAPASLRYMAMMFGEEFSTRAYAHITACLRTGAKRSPTRSSTARKAWSSDRPPTGFMSKRGSWRGCWERRGEGLWMFRRLALQSRPVVVMMPARIDRLWRANLRSRTARHGPTGWSQNDRQ